MPSRERVERYELLGELAMGGMATVYLGRQRGPYGFSRTVAIKSMHPHYAKDESFRAMFLDEATLTSRIRHPNVVPTLDIVCVETKVLLVMEYVDGISLSTLLRTAAKRKIAISPAIAVAIVCDALHGLHAAHELVDDEGRPLAVVHRDVSPQNIHVGLDGLARVLDFGVAKAAIRRYVTQSGEVKGKLAYMAAEQFLGQPVDRRSDIYAAGVVLWETLTGQRLLDAANEGDLVRRVLEGKFEPPSVVAGAPLGEALDRVVLKSLAQTPDDRWSTAEEMALALAEALPPAPRSAVTELVKQLAGDELESRAHRLREHGTPISKDLEPEAKALLSVLAEHATMTSVPGMPRGGKRAALPALGSPTRRRRPILMVAIGILLLAALTGGAFAIGSHTAQREPASLDATAAVPASTAAPPPSLGVAASPSDVPPDPHDPPATATATASGLPTRSAAAAPTRTVRLPPRPTASTQRPTPPPGPDCRMPYTVDANGDRHYKPECVE